MPSIPQDTPCQKCGTTRRRANGLCAECVRVYRHERWIRESAEREAADPGYAMRKFNRESRTHKICNTCQICKPLSEYYAGRTTNGKAGECKDCYKVKRPQRSGKLEQRKQSILDAGVKPCSRCGEVKLLDDFSSSPLTLVGKAPYCKSCHREYKQAYWQKFGAAKNAERLALLRSDPELRQHVRDARRARRKANPEPFKAAEMARRAITRGAPTAERFKKSEIWERDGGRCHICGKKCDPNDWHLDHLVPLSRGGAHTRENVAVSHPFCNISRSNRGPAQLRLLG